jgi:uncharacterized repeat protein (TIGR03803 family)
MAGSYNVLYNFTGGSDGYGPYSALIADNAGNLYGTTPNGGAYNWGTVFELSPHPDGTWTQNVLYSFTGGTDGSYPDHPSLFMDPHGNLYGTTYGGGGSGTCQDTGDGCGTVFKLTPNSDGSWTEKVLYAFSGGADGGSPQATLIADRSGNLYGTTTAGGAYSVGTVFRLGRKNGGDWTETVLYSFTGGNDGANPWIGVIFDTSGNLYGTTVFGGKRGGGVAFKLTPTADGAWAESVLHTFTGGTDGMFPDQARLIFDKNGNLYGTTNQGGAYGWGTAYRLSRSSGASWLFKVVHQFTGSDDGGSPNAGLIMDSSGNFYGTTTGGAIGGGVVFELSKSLTGEWTDEVLYQFTGGGDGGQPWAGLLLDSSGNLYGTTRSGGQYGAGVVFKISK